MIRRWVLLITAIHVASALAEEPWSGERYSLQVQLASKHWETGDAQAALALLHRTAPERRGWEYFRLQYVLGVEQPQIDLGVGVRHVTFSPDGSMIAACSDDLRTRVWKLDGRQLIFNIHNETRSVDFSPDGRRVASGLSGAARVIDVATKRMVRFYSSVPSVAGIPLCCEYSPDGTMLAVESSHRGVHLWRIADRKQTSFTGPDSTRRFAWTADGAELVLVDRHFDGDRHKAEFRLYWHDVITEQITRERTLSGLGAVYDLAVHPDGTVAVADVRGVWLVPPEGGERLLPTPSGGMIHQVAFDPSARWMAAAGEDHCVLLWDLESLATPPISLRAHLDRVSTVAFSPDGETLASGSVDGRIRFWRLSDWLPRPTPGSSRGRALSPRGELLYQRRGAGGAYWLQSDGPQPAQFHHPANHLVLAAAWGGDWLAILPPPPPVLDDQKFTVTVRSRDPQRASIRHKLSYLPRAAAFHPDNNRIAYFGGLRESARGGTTKLSLSVHRWLPQQAATAWDWNVRGSALATDLVYSADGKTLATAATRTRKINQWESAVAVWDERGTKRAELADKGTLTSLAVDQAGKRVAWATSRTDPADRSAAQISVADIAAGQLVQQIKTAGPVAAVRFDPSATRIAALCENRGRPRQLKMWDVSGGSLVYQQACGQSTDLAFRPDGVLVVAGGREAIVLRISEEGGATEGTDNTEDGEPERTTRAEDREGDKEGE